MAEVNSFDVLKEMAKRNNRKIMLVPLSQFMGAKKVKAGCHVTIGAPEEVLTGLAMGTYCGGLLLADREEFDKVAKQLEAAQSSEVPLG